VLLCAYILSWLAIKISVQIEKLNERIFFKLNKHKSTKTKSKNEQVTFGSIEVNKPIEQ
jgi:hypothetical protein